MNKFEECAHHVNSDCRIRWVHHAGRKRVLVQVIPHCIWIKAWWCDPLRVKRQAVLIGVGKPLLGRH